MTPKLYNLDLQTDIPKIKRYDVKTFRKDSFKDQTMPERTFTIEVSEDSSYLYVNEHERDADYNTLKEIFKPK